MAMKVEHNKLSEAIEALASQGFDGLKEAIEILLNEAMLVERNRYLGTLPYERSEERKDYANGYKSKHLKTRIGELSLRIPKVREGEFYPSFLDKGIRSERALRVALAEMYIQGVSTRKVNNILEDLCGFEVSSTEVSRASKLLDEEFRKWKSRPLSSYVYVFLDGTPVQA
jgi:putative transposase